MGVATAAVEWSQSMPNLEVSKSGKWPEASSDANEVLPDANEVDVKDWWLGEEREGMWLAGEWPIPAERVR